MKWPLVLGGSGYVNTHLAMRCDPRSCTGLFSSQTQVRQSPVDRFLRNGIDQLLTTNWPHVLFFPCVPLSSKRRSHDSGAQKGKAIGYNPL